MKSAGKRPHIVVLGGGFGGLTFCQSFPDIADITLVDRQNHHLFQPLLYQVASAGLSSTDIAQPIRGILTHHRHVNVLMDEVTDFRLAEKKIILSEHILHYDYLVMALGGRTTYFGHPEWEKHAPGMKSLADAVTIRNRILYAFEQAEGQPDAAHHQKLMTIVVVGGGPTGVEMAGAMAELARTVLEKDFRKIDPAEARIILIEGNERVLSFLPPHLSQSAKEQLEELGVELMLNTRVKEIGEGYVDLGEHRIEAANVIWAAGVGAAPVTAKLGVELDRAGRVKVQPDCSLPGHPEVFALGDMAALVDAKGVEVPGVSPAAIQMAQYVAKLIRREMTYPEGLKHERQPFTYWDKGTMATIGRARAVAKIGAMEYSGFAAWLSWLFIHLIFLVGLRNRLIVMLQWGYSYITYSRGARVINRANLVKNVPPQKVF